MSFLTGTNTELIYASVNAGTAKNTFTSEAQLNDTTGMGVQAVLPPRFFLPKPSSVGQTIRIVARGILSSTGTPTYQWFVRLGATGSPSTAPLILGSAALTTISGANNQLWELEGDITVVTMGADGANTSVRGLGTVNSAGLATTVGTVWGGAASPGTVSIDTSISNFISLDAACSASSASNSIQLLSLLVLGLN